jgi:CRISPR-associated protein Csm4
MNRVYRFRLRPRSAWRTPWQADTLAGLLCWTCARTRGEGALRAEILEPMLAGRPPFVLSDAFPGELLPVPLVTRLADWPAEARKTVKRARWLGPEAFRRARAGERLDVSDLVLAPLVTEHEQTRNTLDRRTDTTGDAGSLYALPEFRLDLTTPMLHATGWISVYTRVRSASANLLTDLLEELAHVGFGADTSAGRGAFDFPAGAAELEAVDWLGETPNGADGVVALSTFQPAGGDPMLGLWESFTKFGKLGPDLGLDDVRKHPLLLFRPGACFAGERVPFLGRAVPMDELLPAVTAAELRARGIEGVHPAFALAIPATLGLR